MLIALDQLGNAFAFGHPDETISSRLGREKKQGDSAGDIGCAILDAIDTDHCSGSVEATSEGEIQSHHSGRVIRELRPDEPRLRKVVLLAAMALFMVGCAHAQPDPLAGIGKALTRCEPCSRDEACRQTGDGYRCVPWSNQQ